MRRNVIDSLLKVWTFFKNWKPCLFAREMVRIYETDDFLFINFFFLVYIVWCWFLIVIGCAPHAFALLCVSRSLEKGINALVIYREIFIRQRNKVIQKIK